MVEDVRDGIAAKASRYREIAAGAPFVVALVAFTSGDLVREVTDARYGRHAPTWDPGKPGDTERDHARYFRTHRRKFDDGFGEWVGAGRHGIG
jgi:hypothetical protein